MFFKYSQIISMLLALLYIFIKTKNKICLVGSAIGLYILVISHYFNEIETLIPFKLSSYRLFTLILILIVPILLFLGYVFHKSEKRDRSEKDSLVPDISILFKFTRGTIMFWMTIVILNLVAFLLDYSK